MRISDWSSDVCSSDLHLNRNLIGGTTDTTAANLNTRLHIIESIMKELQRILLRLVLDRVERAIDNGFGDGLLAVQHNAVHEFGEHLISELGIRQDNPLFGTTRSEEHTSELQSQM